MQVDPNRIIDIVRRDLGAYEGLVLSRAHVACVFSVLARHTSRVNRGGLVSIHFALERESGDPLLTILQRRRPHGHRVCEGDPLLHMAAHPLSEAQGVQVWAASFDEPSEVIAELPVEGGLLSDDHLRHMIGLTNQALRMAQRRTCG